MVSDESSQSDRSGKTASKKAREARIQRISLEKRRRARTLDPPKSRRTTSYNQPQQRSSAAASSVDAMLLANPYSDRISLHPAVSRSAIVSSFHPISTDLEFDHSLDAILRLRTEDAEYGPDEASL